MLEGLGAERKLGLTDPKPSVADRKASVTDPKPRLTSPELAVTDSKVRLTDPNVGLTDPNVRLTDPKLPLTNATADCTSGSPLFQRQERCGGSLMSGKSSWATTLRHEMGPPCRILVDSRSISSRRFGMLPFPSSSPCNRSSREVFGPDKPRVSLIVWPDGPGGRSAQASGAGAPGNPAAGCRSCWVTGTWRR
jgi:hypothetical protein